MGKIVITGSEGFIGTHLRKELPRAKRIDLKYGRQSVDVLDTALLQAHLEGADTVIHLAAYISVEESRREPQKYIENNIKGTASVIQAAVASDVKRLIYASSAAVFEPDSSPYALTKDAGEKLMNIYKNLIHTTSLRFFNIYGEGQNPHYGAVITAFKNGIENGEITIYGDGKQTRDFIAVEDVVDAIIKSMSSDMPSGHSFNIGTGRETSILELVDIMTNIMDKNPKVQQGPPRTEVRHSRANIDKASRYLNWMPKTDLREGLRRLLK